MEANVLCSRPTTFKLEDVTIHAGESALKECSNIIAINCRFEGKYPFGIPTDSL